MEVKPDTVSAAIAWLAANLPEHQIPYLRNAHTTKIVVVRNKVTLRIRVPGDGTESFYNFEYDTDTQTLTPL